MNKLHDLQPRSHPLKWGFLVHCIENSGMENPDIWIEDLRRYGPCIGVERFVVCKDEDTDGVEASFSVITDIKNNRVIIRHHF